MPNFASFVLRSIYFLRSDNYFRLFKRITVNHINIIKLAMSLTRTLAVFVPYSLSYGMVKTKGTLEKLVGVPEHCQVMDGYF